MLCFDTMSNGSLGEVFDICLGTSSIDAFSLVPGVDGIKLEDVTVVSTWKTSMLLGSTDAEFIIISFLCTML